MIDGENREDYGPVIESGSPMRCNNNNGDNGDSDLLGCLFLYWLLSDDKDKATRRIRGCLTRIMWLILILVILMLISNILMRIFPAG